MSFGRLIHFSLVYTCKWNCSFISSVQFSCSVVLDSLRPHELQQARLTSLSPTPGRVYHQLPEFTQTHVHLVSDDIQPSHPLPSPLLLPPNPPRIRVFSNDSTLRMRCPKYWNFSYCIIPSKEIPGWSPSEWAGWTSLQSKGLLRVFSNTTIQKHQFFSAQPSSQFNSHIHTWPLEKT